MEPSQIEQSLFQLLAVAEEQQKATASALQGLAQERANLQQTINAAVSAALSKAGQEALKDGSKAVALASTKLTSAAQWLSIRILGAFTVGLVAMAFLGFGFVQWEMSEYHSLEKKKQLLEEELPILEEQAAAWEKKAGRATLTVCGPKKKPCVRVNPSAGTYGNKDEVFYILHGS
jgi:hypothetical protein